MSRPKKGHIVDNVDPCRVTKECDYHWHRVHNYECSCISECQGQIYQVHSDLEILPWPYTAYCQYHIDKCPGVRRVTCKCIECETYRSESFADY